MIFINAEKAFDKIQHKFLLKLNKMRKNGYFLIIQCIYLHLNVSTMINEGLLDVTSLKMKMKQYTPSP